MDGNKPMGDNYTPEYYRELGKSLLDSSDRAERSKGLSYIIKAYNEHDPEATYLVGKLTLDGLLKPTEGDREEFALSTLKNASYMGSVQARALLNRYCIDRYGESFGSGEDSPSGPLIGFDGKPLKINRTGVLTPVDVRLEYVDGVNRLSLSANLCISYPEELDDPERFRQAVIDGIREWEGEYTVFGSQKVEIVIELTEESRLYDNVFIIPVTEDLTDSMKKFVNVIGTDRAKENYQTVAEDKRSIAVSGLKWSARSRKVIFICSGSGKFDDYNDIKHVIKHEFGHVLGLGDLYRDEPSKLSGVEKGTYPELDSFYVTERIYNLAMCSYLGPISNNDIEMVILAFSENRMQVYQPQNGIKKPSEALGKGN